MQCDAEIFAAGAELQMIVCSSDARKCHRSYLNRAALAAVRSP
jgi:hypothetical protein